MSTQEIQEIQAQDKRTTVIRIVHNRENPFVQLNRNALWDERISMKAIGLWARCMSRPNDWRFCVKDLIKRSKEGRRSIDSALKELIEFGYALRLEYVERGEDGKYKNSGVEYVFFEFPATEEDKAAQDEIFKKSFQHCCFGNSRYGNSRNAHLLIKNELEIENSTEKEEKKNKKKKEAAPSPSSLFLSDKVKMEQQDYDKLVEDFGSEVVTNTIKALNSYAEQKARKFKEYTSHSAVIRNWISRDIKEKSEKTKSTENIFSINKRLADKIQHTLQDRLKIDIHSDHIGFVFGPKYVPVDFKDKFFKEKVVDVLKSIRIDTDFLKNID